MRIKMAKLKILKKRKPMFDINLLKTVQDIYVTYPIRVATYMSMLEGISYTHYNLPSDNNYCNPMLNHECREIEKSTLSIKLELFSELDYEISKFLMDKFDCELTELEFETVMYYEYELLDGVNILKRKFKIGLLTDDFEHIVTLHIEGGF